MRRVDRAASNQLVHERIRTSFRAGKRKRTWRAPVPGQIRNKHAKVLLSESVRQVRHDFLVSGQAVEEHDSSLGCVASQVKNVGDHVAAACVDHDRGLAVRHGSRHDKAHDAQQGACDGADYWPLHLSAPA